MLSAIPNGSMQFNLFDNGEKSGEFMSINPQKTEMIFGDYEDGEYHGEMRVFALKKREMWEFGKCINDNL